MVVVRAVVSVANLNVVEEIYFSVSLVVGAMGVVVLVGHGGCLGNGWVLVVIMA